MKCSYCGTLLETPYMDKIFGKEWEFYHGDSRAVMRIFNSESFDAVITDPPYNSGGSTIKDRMKLSTKKYVNSNSKYATFPQIAFDGIPETYWEEMMLIVLGHSARVLKKGGLLAVFTDWRRMDKIGGFMAVSGIPPSGVLVWDKTPSARPYKGGFNLQSEFILWGRKKGNLYPNLYAHGVVKGSMILDPFAGVGTTGIACVQNGYSFVGIEVVKEYFDIGVKRLKELENER